MDEKGIRDQLEFERRERAARKRWRREDRERKKRGEPPDERRLAIEWLEEIRKHVARVFRCSLDLTEAVRSFAEDEEDDTPGAVRQRENMRTIWLVVGRFDPQEPVGYLELAAGLSLVRDDWRLEVDINPQRLSQIRVVYLDPRSPRGEGDSVVSQMGPWSYIISDLVGEMSGFGADDRDALAVRYSETGISRFYVYFGSTIVRHVTAAPWQKVKVR